VSLFEDTNPHKLKDLLSQIHNGDSALPDFQRDFVWEPSATQELVVSIASNYPAGSLLRIRNTHDLFARREFEGSPKLNGRKPNFLVLDGQQRLTSLYQAFYGVGEHRFYIALKKLIDGDDFDDAIFHLRATRRRARRLEKFDVHSAELILPLGVLKGGSGGFGKWSRDVTRQLENEDRIRLEDQLAAVEEKWIAPIDDYLFPVVTLSDQTGADAVCTIFETLNRTGVKLSVFELLTARFWPKNVNLRERWDRAREKYSAIEKFEIDPYYILQIISLVARTTPSCKRSDVLNMDSENIEKWWDQAIEGVHQALTILKEDCGVIVPRWLPYATIVIPLAALLAKRPMPTGPDAAVVRSKLVQWFWCSVFGQAYENAPNSQAAKDVTELETWIDGDGVPDTVTNFRFDPRILLDTTPRQRALYRGTICLILRNGARDFHTGQPISGDLIVKNFIDDHHIFPDSYLKKDHLSVPPRMRESVLNRTLIDRATNQHISDLAPAKYLAEIKGSLGDTKFSALLKSHFIPSSSESPIWANDFEKFLEMRRELLWAEIKSVTGLTTESDLLDDADAA
jgi:hypothetical protein